MQAGHKGSSRNYEKVHGPQVLLLKPVCESVHVFSVVLEHKDDGRLPDSAVLLERVRIWSVDGNVEGIGGWRLLSSRCSSVSAENEEIVDGMEVESPVDVRSLEVRVSNVALSYGEWDILTASKEISGG